MKRIICAVLAVVMIVSLAGCGGEKPEEVVERVTQAIKEGKMESVKENIDLNTLESLLPDSGSESTKAATSEESLISVEKPPISRLTIRWARLRSRSFPLKRMAIMPP